jgi:plastocyanin
MKIAKAMGVMAWLGLCASTHAYEGAAVPSGGTITGTVKFVGSPPAPKKLEVTKDKEVCAKTPKSSEDLILSKNKEIKDVVVSLSDIKKGKKLDLQKKPVLDQKGCVYTPHVLLVPAGGPVDILNSDGILHNIHTYPTQNLNQPINKAQPKFKTKMTEKFEKPELIRVQCDAHSWMNAWIMVHDHPYYSVTDDRGQFKLTDVPPGTYTLEVWQESLGKQTKKVTVKEKEEVKVTFELSKKS